MEEAKWHVKTRVVPHSKGFSFPVLEFRWGTEEFTGGTVRIWPQTKVIEVKSNRDTEKTNILLGEYREIESAVSAIKETFGSLPPNFSEAFEIMRCLHERYERKIVGPEAAQKFFDEIKAKWQSLIGN